MRERIPSNIDPRKYIDYTPDNVGRIADIGLAQVVAKKENDIRASQTNHVANLGLNDILEIEKAMENEIRERVQELRNKILAGYCIDVFRKEMYLSRHSELPRVVSDDDLGGRINLLLIL